METGKNTPFATSLISPVLKFRWYNCNCTQLQLPDGTTILFDPYLPLGEEQLHENMNHFSEDHLERVDFVIINHSHLDHVGTLDRTWQKYHPMIICHQSVAMLLSETKGIPCDNMIPIDNGQTYDFGAFKLETLLGSHVMFSKGMPKGMGKIREQDAKHELLGRMGFTFNTNYIVTTPNGYRIGFGPGLYECLQHTHMNEKALDLFFRQYYPNDRPIERRGTLAEDFADELQFVGAPLNVPIHHEMTYIPNNTYDDMNVFAQEVNAELAKRGSICRLINPERGRWYTVNSQIQAL